MTTIDRVNRVASGEVVSGVVIYWDEQVPGNHGPAYRDGADYGSLSFAGWAGGEAAEYEGLEVGHYFSAHGEYFGPDRDGVYPTFLDD